jgi:hypothetical protein
MGLRKPLQTIGNFTAAASEVGGGSVAGGIAYTFKIPQDTDNVVLKFTASVAGAGYSAVFQTTDDGGNTYYDVARTSIVSNANNTTAEWLSIPVITTGFTASRPVTGSVLSTVGSAAASTLAAGQFSGLPLLSDLGRVFVRITGNITNAAANTYVAQVKANSESNQA